MANDIERLTVVLEANIKKYEKEMARTRGVMDKAMREVERTASGSMKRLEGIVGSIGGRFKVGLAGVLAGLSIQQVAQLADSFTKVQNSLKVAGLEGQELHRTYEQLYAAAQRQGAPLEAMAALYSRVSSAQKDLNATGPEMLRVTEGVAMALRASGTSATEASGALLQLGQALSGGKVQAEEYNSLLDGARPVLQAVAAGMVEAGGSVSKLTALVKDGKVSSEAFFRALLAGMPLLEQQAQTAGQTMSQGWQKAENSLVNLVGKLDEAFQASNNAASGLNGVAATIDKIADAVPGAMGYLDQLQSKMTEIGNWQGFKKLGDWFDQHGMLDKSILEPVNSFDDVFGVKTDAGSMAGYKLGAPNDPSRVESAAITPIRNSDYKVPDDDKEGRKRRERLNDLQREIQQIGERTRALDVERQTIGLSAGDTAKAEAAFRLLEAAKQANIDITPQLQAQIDSLGTAYGEATQRIEDAREAQERAADAVQEFQSIARDSLGGFISDLRQGKSAADAFGHVLEGLADKFLDMAINGIFDSKGGGGLLGSLLGGLTGGGGGLSLNPTGRAGGGPVKAGVGYTVGESGRETFVPTTPGRIVPNGRGGGGLQVVVNNNAGAQVSTRQERGPSGDMRVVLDVVKADMMRETTRNGGFSKAMGAPFRGRG